MVEDKITAFDSFESAALFSSGMGAISGTCFALLRPGDSILFADPVYGGTEYLFRHLLPEFGIKSIPFRAGASREVMEDLVKNDASIKMIYAEAPANPTIIFTDIKAMSDIAKKYSTENRKIYTIVDNTFLGPVFCRPKELGADLAIYSATKFIGGHSDIVAGIVLCDKNLIGSIKATRTILGSNSDPDTSWLILRSLGTLQLRMEKQQENCKKVVDFLLKHPCVKSVSYPGLDSMGETQLKIFRDQFKGSGSVLSFDIKGGETEAFKVLNSVKHIYLAVSLGGIETLIEHPYSMTHADMTAKEKDLAGIGQSMIRLSVGLEDPEDLIEDLGQALDLIV